MWCDRILLDVSGFSFKFFINICILYLMMSFPFILFITDESFQCSHCLKHCGSERILRDHMRHHGMFQMVVLYMLQFKMKFSYNLV